MPVRLRPVTSWLICAVPSGIVSMRALRKCQIRRHRAIAEKVKASSPLGIAGIKQMVNFGTDLEFEDAVALNEKLRRPLEATKVNHARHLALQLAGTRGAAAQRRRQPRSV